MVQTALDNFEKHALKPIIWANIRTNQTLSGWLEKYSTNGSKPLRTLMDLMRRSSRDETTGISNFMNSLGLNHDVETKTNLIGIWKDSKISTKRSEFIFLLTTNRLHLNDRAHHYSDTNHECTFCQMKYMEMRAGELETLQGYGQGRKMPFHVIKGLTGLQIMY